MTSVLEVAACRVIAVQVKPHIGLCNVIRRQKPQTAEAAVGATGFAIPAASSKHAPVHVMSIPRLAT